MVIIKNNKTYNVEILNNTTYNLQSKYETPNYFYVEDASGSSNTLSIRKNNANAPTITVYKSTDQTTWESMGNTSTTAITATVPANGKLYLKATTDGWGSGIYYNNITTSGNYNVGGNIMSLLYGDNYLNQISFPSSMSTIRPFYYLFYNSTTLISAENLALPATTLKNQCYGYMFRGCSSLTTAPALPATTLAVGCYQAMFWGCTSLTTTPVLPVTTLTNNCYDSMFRDCTSLTTAPTLPATTLTRNCYNRMFYGCTSLTQSPALPANILTNDCYFGMFQGCTSLNTVTTYANDISASYCLESWLDGVAATGDFYNLGGATYPSGANGIPVNWTEHNTL